MVNTVICVFFVNIHKIHFYNFIIIFQSIENIYFNWSLEHCQDWTVNSLTSKTYDFSFVLYIPYSFELILLINSYTFSIKTFFKPLYFLTEELIIVGNLKKLIYQLFQNVENSN